MKVKIFGQKKKYGHWGFSSMTDEMKPWQTLECIATIIQKEGTFLWFDENQ